MQRHFKSLAKIDPRMSDKMTIERKATVQRNEVVDFFLRDDNSRATAGKKETRTSKGVKQQIRYLNFTMDQLYHKFLSERGPDAEPIGKLSCYAIL